MEPQLVLVYNNQGYVTRSYFLTPLVLDEKSFAVSFYNVLKENNSSNFPKDYELINYHIPLTYNVERIKGTLAYLLDIPNPFILFSLTENIEFYYNDKRIFNPFKQDDKFQVLHRNKTDSLINFYTHAVNRLVLCVLEANENSSSLVKNNATFGEFDEEDYDWMEKILNNIALNKYELTTEENIFIMYTCTLPWSLVFSLLDDPNYIVEYQDYANGKYTVSGRLVLDTSLDDFSFSVYKDKDLIFNYNNTLFIVNDKLWNEIPQDYKKDLEIKGKQESRKSVVKFDTKLNFSLNLNINFNFIIKPTEKTKNIYSDVSNKINIITSLDHITYRYKTNYPGFSKYLTYIILGYNHIDNDIEGLKKNVKVHNLYISRFCQNSKTVFRKPIVTTEEFDPTKYDKLSSNFYRGKEIEITKMGKNNKVNVTTKKVSDIYIDSYDVAYRCPDADIPHLGFLDNVLNQSNICIPCCYNQNKENSASFKKCAGTSKSVIPSKKGNSISPFVQLNKEEGRNKLRKLTSNDQLGDLSHYNKYFNKNSKVKYISSRLVEARNYIMYKNYDYLSNIKTIEDLFDFFDTLEGESINSFVIYEDRIYTNIVDDGEYSLFIIIGGKVHSLVSVDKVSQRDKININPIQKDVVKRVLGEFKSTFDDKQLSYKGKKNIEINYNNVYVDGRIFIPPKIKSFVKFNNAPKLKIPYNVDDIDVLGSIDVYEDIRNINYYNSL